MSEKIVGKRQDVDDTHPVLNAGEYGNCDGFWMGVPPGTDLLAGLSKHEVTEHEDGTITVSPSILVRDWRGNQWHGYLERGVWREV